MGVEGPNWEAAAADIPPAVDPEGEPTERRSFLSSALTTFGAHLGVGAFSFANVLIISRALGPSGRGQVALLTTIAVTMSFVCTLGVQEANVNFAGVDPSLRRSLATNSVVLALVTGSVSAVVLGTLMMAFPAIAGHAAVWLRWLTLASIPIVVLQMFLARLVQADYRFELSNAALLCPPVTTAVVNGVFMAIGLLSVGSAVTLWVIGQTIGTTLLVVAIVHSYGFGRPSAALARRAIGFGMRIYPGTFMNQSNYRLDSWLLGGIAGTAELGLYSVAVAWAEALFLVPQVLGVVQRPDLVRGSRVEAVRQASRAFRAAIVATAVLAAAIFVLAPVLCTTIFGPDFHGSIRDLRMLVPGAFGIVALQVLGNALTARNRPLLQTASIGVTFVFTIVLDLLLIPVHGDFGAAVASAVAYSMGGAAVALIFIRGLGGRGADLLPRRSDALLFAHLGRRAVVRMRARHGALAQ